MILPTDTQIQINHRSTALLSLPSPLCLYGNEKNTEKNSVGFELHLSVTERRQGHLRLSLDVPSTSESQVDLFSNEDPANMRAVTGGGVTQRCHCWSGTLISSFTELQWDGIIRGRDGCKDSGPNQTRQWDGNDIFSCSEQRGQIVVIFDCFSGPNPFVCPLLYKS